jgi:hypothetical protein
VSGISAALGGSMVSARSALRRGERSGKEVSGFLCVGRG